MTNRKKTPEEQSQEIMKSTMPDSWEEELEIVNRKCNEAYGTGKFPPELKSFIHSLLKQERQRVVGEIRKVLNKIKDTFGGETSTWENDRKCINFMSEQLSNLIQKLNEKE